MIDPEDFEDYDNTTPDRTLFACIAVGLVTLAWGIYAVCSVIFE